MFWNLVLPSSDANLTFLSLDWNIMRSIWYVVVNCASPLRLIGPSMNERCLCSIGILWRPWDVLLFGSRKLFDSRETLLGEGQNYLLDGPQMWTFMPSFLIIFNNSGIAEIIFDRYFELRKSNELNSVGTTSSSDGKHANKFSVMRYPTRFWMRYQHLQSSYWGILWIRKLFSG
jgi:hypothetical protein